MSQQDFNRIDQIRSFIDAQHERIGGRLSEDLTFRDRLIIAALQGILSNPSVTSSKTIVYEDEMEIQELVSNAEIEAVRQADGVIRTMFNDQVDANRSEMKRGRSIDPAWKDYLTDWGNKPCDPESESEKGDLLFDLN